MAKDTKPSAKGLHVIILGGTIDFCSSTFEELESGEVDLLVPRKQSIIPYFLEKRIHYDFGETCFSRIDVIDSRDIRSEHIKQLISEINNSPYSRILVTMGTSLMHEVAKQLREEDFGSKIIGLVGSRQPLSNYQSDAGFMLGFSIGKLFTLAKGVYTFHPNEVRESVLRTLKEIVIITTGGTIESYYSAKSGQETPYESSSIPTYFKQALGIVPTEPHFLFRQVSMKDSRNLTQSDFRRLLEESKAQRHKKQLILAGTYGLPDISRRFKYIVSQGKHPKNSYLFLGAMFPEDTHLNDGWYNLGLGIAKIETVPEDILCSMHSWVTKTDNLWKQLNEGRFLLHDRNETY